MMRTLLMLPGHMCDARLWAGVAPALEAANYRVINAELTTADTVESLAADVLAEAPDSFTAVGLSMGGIVALELFRQQPYRLQGLVLCDTNAAPELPDRATMRRAQQAKVRAGELAEVVREELKPNYLAAANQGRQDLLDLTLTMAMDLGDGVFLRQSEGLLHRPDARPLLPTITCPTLLLCGEEDSLCPPALHRAMAEAIPGSTFTTINTAGHLPPLEQPAAFATALLDWLSQSHGAVIKNDS
jgi:pimeloyl-ACP methyl ester carboxylesterase